MLVGSSLVQSKRQSSRSRLCATCKSTTG